MWLQSFIPGLKQGPIQIKPGDIYDDHNTQRITYTYNVHTKFVITPVFMFMFFMFLRFHNCYFDEFIIAILPCLCNPVLSSCLLYL